MTNYAAAQTTKDNGSNPVPRKIFQKYQEHHAIINNVVDDILLNEQKIVSVVKHEATEFLDNKYNANDLYQVEIRVLTITKKKLTDVSMRLNTKFYM